MSRTLGFQVDKISGRICVQYQAPSLTKHTATIFFTSSFSSPVCMPLQTPNKLRSTIILIPESPLQTKDMNKNTEFDPAEFPWNVPNQVRKKPRFQIDNRSFYASKSAQDVQKDGGQKKRKLIRKADIKIVNQDPVIMPQDHHHGSSKNHLIPVLDEDHLHGSSKNHIIPVIDEDQVFIIDDTPAKFSTSRDESFSKPILIDDSPIKLETNVGISLKNDSPLKKQSFLVEKDTLHFLNSEDAIGLVEALKCSKEQAASIIASRPFITVDDIDLFDFAIIRLIHKYMDILTEIRSVDDVINHCDIVGQEIKTALEQWDDILLRDNDPASNCKHQYLRTQPDVINPAYTLKQYQLTGISWMMMLYNMNFGGILADEMGLGKSAQVVGFIGLLASKEGFGSGLNLIIVPSSTLDNWMREIEQWCPRLNAISYSGTMPERRELQYEIADRTDLDVIVTT